MIRKLQKRFVRIAVLSLTLAMVLVVGIVNAVNLISVRNELANTLELLAYGNAPSAPENAEQPEAVREQDTSSVQEKQNDAEELPAPFWLGNRHFRNMVNESNWFTVHYEVDGTIRSQNLLRMGDADEEACLALAAQILETGKESGWIQDYCFRVREEGSRGKSVLVLNCETRMTAVRTLALISGIACVGGILLAWLLMRLASRKAVDPVIRNMEEQKRFITDASHELKTPLTVISTNMELLKMEILENQWIRSTQKQTASMRHLVDELVYLSRMEEESPALTMEPIALGSILRETAEPFQAMAEFNGKELQVETEDNLQIIGDRASIQRLISTLCENATKYTPEGGRILVRATTEGRNAVLEVSNPVEEPLSKEQCEMLFNRFYRGDPSRNKGKQGGFGIGLSIALAIAEKHGGSIRAEMDGDRLKMTCILPRENKKG